MRLQPLAHCRCARASTLTGPVAQRHRLALLSLLALFPGRAIARDKLLAWLWPESDTASARHLLNTATHAVRRALGDDVLGSNGDQIVLADPVAVDVLEFQARLDRGERSDTVGLYRAPFLDGFFLNGAVELDQWVERERARLATAYREALESLAAAAQDRDDLAEATRWWRALTHEDPYNTRAVTRLMLALEHGGDWGNALRSKLGERRTRSGQRRSTMSRASRTEGERRGELGALPTGPRHPHSRQGFQRTASERVCAAAGAQG